MDKKDKIDLHFKLGGFVFTIIFSIGVIFEIMKEFIITPHIIIKVIAIIFLLLITGIIIYTAKNLK